MRQAREARKAVTDTLLEPSETTRSEPGSAAIRQKYGHSIWQPWYYACKQIWPIYLATHAAFLLLTYLATLFHFGNFARDRLPIATLWWAWDRWDSSQFIAIATQGYDAPWRTAFFPLYPLLEHILSLLVGSPFSAGLLISNLMGLVLFTVLYRLVMEDFEHVQAYRTVLYLALFPTAFFLAATYNESLFLSLTLLSFYQMRRGKWWWAGAFGLLASLTRSAGLFLLIPFCYEYLLQYRLRSRPIEVHALSGLLIPAGIGLFAVYNALRFGDALAFSHAQAVWGRQLTLPGLSFARTVWVIIRTGPLSFSALHGVIDLGAGLLMLLLVSLCFIGPWKFSRQLQAYGLYAAGLYLFLILFPSRDVPLQSLSRLVLELFPAFVVLAAIGKKATFNLYYLMLTGTLLCFMLLQFLTGYWIV